MKKVFRIILLSLMVLSLTACGNKVRFYTDQEVDNYIQKKFPGSTYVSKTKAQPTAGNSSKQEKNMTYTYVDANGRQFSVTTWVHYSDDLSGKKIDWLYTKKIEQAYKKEVFISCQNEIEEYLRKEQIEYEIKDGSDSIVLKIKLPDNDEESVMHIAEACYCIDNYILQFNENDSMDEYSELMMGYVNLHIVYVNADGNEKTVPGYKISFSSNPQDRRDIQYFYDNIKSEIE